VYKQFADTGFDTVKGIYDNVVGDAIDMYDAFGQF
jgi:hypothetical protein